MEAKRTEKKGAAKNCKAAAYEKDQILMAQRCRRFGDFLSAKLDKGTRYTLLEVQEMIDEYLKKAVE